MLESIVDVQQHVNSIAESLLTEDDSWTVVAPPGFGGEEVARRIAAALRLHHSDPLVAVLSPDDLPDPRAYIQDLFRQWSRNCSIRTPNPHVSDSVALASLLYNDLPGDRRAIQIVNRFHCAITRLGDWVLGALRTAESESKIRSVVITPYDLMYLRDQWRDEGHALTVSNYGDIHLQWPLELEETEVCVGRLMQQGIPAHVAEYCVELTGGYPDVLKVVIREWRALNSKHFRPEDRRKLSRKAQAALLRLVRRLDSPVETHYRDALMNIHLGIDAVAAYCDLEFHPWKQFLLQTDGTLRASELGRAAVLDEVRNTIKRSASGAGILGRAEALYRRGEYDATHQLVRSFSEDLDGANSVILVRNTRIMQLLNQLDGLGSVEEWKAIRKSCVKAKELVSRHSHTIDIGQLTERYEQLADLAAFVANAAANAQSRHQDRVLDVLGGLFGDNAKEPPVALAMMLRLQQRSKVMLGHVAALESAFPLPEQTFRLWAYWSLGLNYYSSPSPKNALWDSADSIFRQRLGRETQLIRRPEGKPFHSFLAFAAYCLAATEQIPGSVTFITDPAELRSDLSVFDSIRNPRAHAVCSTRSTQRQKFFELCDRWLAGTINALGTPDEADKISRYFDQLPLYDDLKIGETLE